MRESWEALQKSTMRLGDVEATGLGVLCLTAIIVAAFALR
jgi:hypothetical protein